MTHAEPETVESVITGQVPVPDIPTSTNQPESAHIVMVPEGEDDETPQAYVMRARIEGFAITALCGYTWIPYRSVTGLPVCQECKDIYDNDPLWDGSDDHSLPDE